MRIWSIHPQYLDRMGLLGAWREALLIRKILRGETRAYRNHPQVKKIVDTDCVKGIINSYILALWKEADCRDYCFKKVVDDEGYDFNEFDVSQEQLIYEMAHLQVKLWKRNRTKYHKNVKRLQREMQVYANDGMCESLGNPGIASWERPKPESLKMMEKVKRWME